MALLTSALARDESRGILGTIVYLDGDHFTMTTKDGEGIIVDASEAKSKFMSVVLYEGENVAVYGARDNTGAVHATAIVRVKDPSNWVDQ